MEYFAVACLAPRGVGGVRGVGVVGGVGGVFFRYVNV
jgi:hypothetical protein